MPGVPQHIIQRTRGQARCVVRAADRLSLLDALCDFAPHYECAVHAYVFMVNHLHLLLTPSQANDGRNLVRATCERYQQYIAERYESDAAVWNEDPEIRPIHARRYLLACMRYIELNPVRAQIAAHAADYRWSSYRANALGYLDPIVTPHPLYYALGRSPETRRAAYARFVRRGFPRPDSASP